VTNAPYDGHRTTDVDWNLVGSCNLNQIRTQEAGSQNLVPLSYFKSGTRTKAETNVGIPMTSPENVSPPPNRSAYTLDDGTTMKNEIWCFLETSTEDPPSWEKTGNYLHECVCHEHQDQRTRFWELKLWIFFISDGHFFRVCGLWLFPRA
jgi:hypothetical protein